MDSCPQPQPASPAGAEDHDPAQRYRSQLECLLGSAFTRGNTVEVFRNGDEIFPAMLKSIDEADTSICLTTFVYWTGDIARTFADALSKKARAGVRVRVVLDAVGANKMSRKLVDEMKAAGVRIRWFRPFSWLRPWHFDKRTHRKILVCDGKHGFTGGVGIAKEWEGNAETTSQFRETHVRITGPAVSGLQSAFLDNWNECGEWDNACTVNLPRQTGGEVEMQVVRASSTIGWTSSATLVRSLVELARERLRITSAYFAPDDILVELLLAAHARGVKVELLLPGKHCDSQISRLAGHPSLQRLLDAGLSAWTYGPAMIHAKVITIDGVVSFVGSVNMNHRSMGKDEECGALALDRDLVDILDRQFEEDCATSHRLDAATFRRRGAWLKFRERLARLVLGEV